MKHGFNKFHKSKKVVQIVAALGSGLGFVKNSTADVLRRVMWAQPRNQLARLPQLFKEGPFNDKGFSTLQTPSNAQAEQVVRSTQHVRSASIAGTWIQTVYDSSGAPVYQSGEVLEQVPQSLATRVEHFEMRKAEARDVLLKTLAAYRLSTVRFEPDLQIVHTANGVYSLEYIFGFISANDSQAFEARLNESLEILSVQVRGSSAVMGIGSVYQPASNSLTVSDVNFSEMSADQDDLSSHLARVYSAKPEQARSSERIFRYEPSDVRFEQVQVYFFADQILSWFKTRFDAEPKARLEIKVQVGDNSNTAFYYRNSVRLGSGDGLKYKQMAYDPTIVSHEIAHAIVDRYAGLPSDGEGGALNEAFADYFAASLWDQPKIGSSAYMAGPFIRTLENSETASSAFSQGLYKASQVFSGALWDLGIALGRTTGDSLAFRCLSRLGPGSKHLDFAPALLAASASLSLSPDQNAKISQVLLARGIQ